MQGEFKQCPNGHYYQGVSCPYCKTGNQQSSANGTSLRTEMFMGGDSETVHEHPYGTSNSTSGSRTQLVNENETRVSRGSKVGANHRGTVFGDEEETNFVSLDEPRPNKEPRYGRKLVGWLVTYSFDDLGVDYKLYEGRNIIGRDVDCNITVNDGRMSGKHAVLLFRANKYSLTDSQSSHGTFVNDEDIELEPQYLNDGDIIRMGSTVFKFRSSL